MNRWLANSVKNLVPLSKSRDFKEALAEWFFTGEVDDYEDEEEGIVCELCEHPDLVHHFHIKNARTEHSLLVGSSCILKFQQIEIRDARGEVILEQALRKKALDVALRKKIVDSSLEPLRRLWKVDKAKRNQVQFLAHEIKRDQGLTPKQLDDLFTFFEGHQIPYAAKQYKVNLRSYEASSEISRMSSKSFHRLCPALSHQQLARLKRVAR